MLCDALYKHLSSMAAATSRYARTQTASAHEALRAAFATAKPQGFATASPHWMHRENGPATEPAAGEINEVLRSRFSLSAATTDRFAPAQKVSAYDALGSTVTATQPKDIAITSSSLWMHRENGPATEPPAGEIDKLPHGGRPFACASLLRHSRGCDCRGCRARQSFVVPLRGDTTDALTHPRAAASVVRQSETATDAPGFT
jgi:hypothetical protein